MSNLNELIVDVTATVVSPTEFQAEADVEISNQFSATASADLVVKIEGGDDIQIPTVTNIKVDEYGLLTFDEPDFSKLEKFNPIISYLITVNGTQIESTTNSVSILSMLVDGDNIIDVKTKAILTTYSENVEEVIQYEKPPYTDPSLFTYRSITLDGVEGWEVTAYNGTDESISIPPYNTDGLPILSLYDTSNKSCKNVTGLFIKNITQQNLTFNWVEIFDLPALEMTDMRELFRGKDSVITFRALNTSKGVNLGYLFAQMDKLKSIPEIDTSNAEYMYDMFYNCPELESIPWMNTSKVKDMDSAFRSCPKLTIIPAYDVSNVNEMDYTFLGSTSLKSILMYGMKVSFDLSSSTKFERENLVTILNNLATVTTTQTLTLGEVNLAKLTDEDKKIATDKGWTLA